MTTIPDASTPAPTEPFTARRDRLRSLLREHGLPALLVTSMINIRYLTGFSGSTGALVVLADDAGADLLAVDDRYGERAASEAPGIGVEVTRKLTDAMLGRVRESAASRLGFEEHVVTVESHDTLATAAAGLELLRTHRLIERLRTIKDEIEIGYLREACAIADRALVDVLPTIGVGRTEREIADALEAAMRAHGADDKGFDTIAASGPHSAIPHHQPTDRAIEAGDFLKLDFGSRYRGYHSDMTRTMVVGGKPADWQRDLYALVRAAQRAGRHALAPGAGLAAVDAAARDVITDAGHGEHFRHGLGHGVGLQIHEDPFFRGDATGTLAAGMPVTVEPGVYLAGRCGVRIEDTLVVRPDGAPELLTQTTKELLVLA